MARVPHVAPRYDSPRGGTAPFGMATIDRTPPSTVFPQQDKRSSTKEWYGVWSRSSYQMQSAPEIAEVETADAASRGGSQIRAAKPRRK